MTRSFVLAVVAASMGFSVPAMAQDGSSWDGWYVGLNLGTSLGLMHTPVKAALSTTSANYTMDSDFKQSGWGIIGGAQVGYNYLLPNGVLIGAEIDGSGTSISETLAGTTPVLNTASTVNYKLRRNIDFVNTARLRVGLVTANDMLVYATGGLAYGGVGTFYDSSTQNGASNTLGINADNYSVDVGWTMGAGFELPLQDKFRLRAEYLYADLGSRTLVSGTFNLPYLTGTEDFRVSNRAHIMRVAVNYALH